MDSICLQNREHSPRKLDGFLGSDSGQISRESGLISKMPGNLANH